MKKKINKKQCTLQHASAYQANVLDAAMFCSVWQRFIKLSHNVNILSTSLAPYTRATRPKYDQIGVHVDAEVIDSTIMRPTTKSPKRRTSPKQKHEYVQVYDGFSRTRSLAHSLRKMNLFRRMLITPHAATAAAALEAFVFQPTLAREMLQRVLLSLRTTNLSIRLAENRGWNEENKIMKTELNVCVCVY